VKNTTKSTNIGIIILLNELFISSSVSLGKYREFAFCNSVVTIQLNSNIANFVGGKHIYAGVLMTHLKIC